MPEIALPRPNLGPVDFYPQVLVSPEVRPQVKPEAKLERQEKVTTHRSFARLAGKMGIFQRLAG